jgi:drug/metabolite transporter (DMT)-like permease
MVYLAPFLSVFFLWLILGKPIGAAAIAGMALIAAGGAAAAWRREAGRGPGSNG